MTVNTNSRRVSKTGCSAYAVPPSRAHKSILCENPVQALLLTARENNVRAATIHESMRKPVGVQSTAFNRGIFFKGIVYQETG